MTNKITDCAAWLALQSHYQQQRHTTLAQLFSTSPDRFQQFSFEAADIFIDYSKNHATSKTIDLLCALAIERQVPEAIRAFFSGEKINYSEQRAALHTVYRLPAEHSFLFEGTDLVAAVQCEFEKMIDIAQQLEKKELKGFSGKPIDTVLHVGMGGSALGPALYYQALKSDAKKITCHFLTEFDYAAIQEKLALCCPETTMVVIVSKSFATPETLAIFHTIKNWLGNHATHFYAVTAQTECAIANGFLQDHILKIWDWVGGRYSIWSAVSFSVVLALGVDCFKRFLAGAYQMDQHVQHAPLSQNMPVIMALLNVWYNNFFHAHTQAIIPYSPRLLLLPSYLQQLHMESLGKSVTLQGEKTQYATGRVIWGDVGPNSQHSFHQLLMQGSHLIPVDFILPLRDQKPNDYDVKRAAYCLSQSQTLLAGVETQSSHQVIDGNRPSTTIIIEQLTPETLGALLAFYEHKVFVQSVIWGINAFDQWGVEQSKQVAETFITCLNEHQKIAETDSSTRGLLEKISRSLQA